MGTARAAMTTDTIPSVFPTPGASPYASRGESERAIETEPEELSLSPSTLPFDETEYIFDKSTVVAPPWYGVREALTPVAAAAALQDSRSLLHLSRPVSASGQLRGRGDARCAPRGNDERLGRYRLLERLGKGGMAEVFRAVAEGPHGFRRVCALKRILPEFAHSRCFQDLLADEAYISARLHHPHLVDVYDFGSVSGEPYLVMEYLDGQDLATVLKALSRDKRKMSPAAAVGIARQLARGLAYAHTIRGDDGQPLNLVHRDVSPDNVMLLGTGTVKLLDFGIALFDPHGAAAGAHDRILRGKLGYASPEQSQGLPVDRRSDVFSLGVVLWEMLTCRRLFLADSDADTLQRVLWSPCPEPSMVSPQVPSSLDAVVMKALAREPEARYESAEAFLEALELALQSVPGGEDVLAQFETTSRGAVETPGPSAPASTRSLIALTPSRYERTDVLELPSRRRHVMVKVAASAGLALGLLWGIGAPRPERSHVGANHLEPTKGISLSLMRAGENQIAEEVRLVPPPVRERSLPSAKDLSESTFPFVGPRQPPPRLSAEPSPPPSSLHVNPFLP